ncbi:MAG: rhodanese-like domain-containing protein [Bacillota bacterium]|nr:rhodanese-like domain-containing protein [Bacillota bacterium]
MEDKKITPEELYEKLQKNERVYILDVRAEEKYTEFHIEDPRIESVNVPKNFILEGKGEASSLPEKEEVIVVCTTGNSAAKCANILAQQQEKVVVLEGGITAWKDFIKTR